MPRGDGHAWNWLSIIHNIGIYLIFLLIPRLKMFIIKALPFQILRPLDFPNMSHNINAYLSCLRMLVSVERYPESGRFPITSFTAFSWRTVEYSKNAVQDQQVVPLLNTTSSNNDSVRRGHYRFYMTYLPVRWEMPLCGKLTRPVQPPKCEMIPICLLK